MSHRVMHIDIETYSSADLTESGVYAYACAPDFTVLIASWKFDDEEEIRTIDFTAPNAMPSDAVSELIEQLTDPEIEKHAFNANFERTCLAVFFRQRMDPKQWRCTMVKALTLGLPGSLANAGAALGLPEEKLKDPQGKALIQYFSKPCRPTKSNGGRTRNLPAHDPEKWALYVKYNRQDVVTECEIADRLSKYQTTETEQRLWALDQEMNDNGVRIDRELVDRIVAYDEVRREELADEAKRLTGLANPNSVAQLKQWLDKRGMSVDSVNKDVVADLLAYNDLPDDVRRVLEIRTALGKTSVAKYAAMQAAACPDDRVRGILQFYGANRSGRWAGRLVQIQNLARNTLPDLELARELTRKGDFETLEMLFGEPAFVFSELVRTAFIPSEGCRFIVSDFAAIEARVIAWVAGEQWVLDAFAAGKDIYCETASMMYHVPVVKHGENGHLRAKGKVAVLACGYQGGVSAMRRMDSSGAIPDDELQAAVDMWRAANPNIVKLWGAYERSAKTAITEHRTLRRGGLEFSYIDGNLFVQLPSGRKLCYWAAHLKQNPVNGREQIVYMGVNQDTKQWVETETYGGKLVENVVQAIARDCLATALTRVRELGYTVVMHIHDEMVVDVPIEDTEAVDKIAAVMSSPIDWAPGLPLRGDTYETPFYRKD